MQYRDWTLPYITQCECTVCALHLLAHSPTHFLFGNHLFILYTKLLILLMILSLFPFHWARWENRKRDFWDKVLPNNGMSENVFKLCNSIDSSCYLTTFVYHCIGLCVFSRRYSVWYWYIPERFFTNSFIMKY